MVTVASPERNPDDEEEGSKGGGNFKRRKPLPSLFREEQKVDIGISLAIPKEPKQNADDGFSNFSKFKTNRNQNIPK